MGKSTPEKPAPITPYLYYENVAGAMDWLSRVFGFRERTKETMRSPEGRVVHTAMELGDGVIATAQTGIPHSAPAGSFLSGYPAIENRAWLKSSAVFAKLPELQKRVRELERLVEELRAGGPFR